MNENFDAWVEVLATTTLPQGRGYLRSRDGDGYCCLGVGVLMMPEELLEGARNLWLEPDAHEYPPREFLEWIGAQAGVGMFDIVIDWPYDRSFMNRKGGWLGDLKGGAELNDSGFTFKQIADILRYFGVQS